MPYYPVIDNLVMQQNLHRMKVDMETSHHKQFSSTFINKKHNSLINSSVYTGNSLNFRLIDRQ